jgi:hypothetical protein
LIYSSFFSPLDYPLCHDEDEDEEEEEEEEDEGA